MPLYKLVVAYDGTRFNGFQRQINNHEMMKRRESRPAKRPHWESTGKRKNVAVTVQDCIEDALMSYGSTSVEDLCVRFAGRTDKGVHARGQVVVANMEPPEGDDFHQVQKSLNSRLPFDISVESVGLSSADFNPRKDVTRKIYSYTIKYRRKLPEPNDRNKLGLHSIRQAFDSPCLWVCPWALDDQNMQSLCQLLQGNHNFRCFVHKQDRDGRDHTFSVDKIQWTVEKDQDDVVTARWQFEAKGFRRSMIRNFVGFCVDIGRGHLCVESLGGWEAIWSGHEDVAKRINAAPAAGLCLEQVFY